MSRFGLFLAGLIFVCGLNSLAQDSSQPAAPPAVRPKRHAKQGDRAEMRLRRISKRLNLTAEQKEKLLPILQDESKRVKEVGDDASLTQQDKHKKLKEIHRATRLQMDDILTDEQKQKLPAQRPQGAGARGKRRSQPSSTAPAPEPNSPQ